MREPNREESKRAQQEAAAKKRLDDAKQAMADEREAHRLTTEADALKSKSELDVLLDTLPEPERRAIRLQAYTLVRSGDYDAGTLQSRVDDMALKMARYAIEGLV
jgi:hypothetical protein